MQRVKKRGGKGLMIQKVFLYKFKKKLKKVNGERPGLKEEGKKRVTLNGPPTA